MTNNPGLAARTPLTATMVRARAKKAAIMASQKDAVLKPVQASRGTTRTIEAIPTAAPARPG